MVDAMLRFFFEVRCNSVSLTHLSHLQILLSNMVYADDDESLVDAEVNFFGYLCFWCI